MVCWNNSSIFGLYCFNVCCSLKMATAWPTWVWLICVFCTDETISFIGLCVSICFSVYNSFQCFSKGLIITICLGTNRFLTFSVHSRWIFCLAISVLFVLSANQKLFFSSGIWNRKSSQRRSCASQSKWLDISCKAIFC